MRFPVYTATMILPGVGPAMMVDVEVAGTVYLANGTVIGYDREATSNTFLDPKKTCKTKLYRDI